MSQSEAYRNASATAMRGNPDTRVDAAHVAVDEIAAVEAPIEAPAVTPQLVEQVRSQASQLGAHLKRQLADVDHREAELNARLADMENQLRGARLWLDQQHQELAARKADL